MDTMHIALASLRDHEGLRLEPYKCTAGKTTIGYGRNLDDRGIDLDEAERMLTRDANDAMEDCETFDYWPRLNARRQAAMIDMRFCLGAGGFRQFQKMHAALEAEDFDEAADQILDSRFAQQTGRRATDLAKMVREG